MKGVQKAEKNFESFFIKSILSIIYELSQDLESLSLLWKVPETKTLGGTLPPVESRVNDPVIIGPENIT